MSVAFSRIRGIVLWNSRRAYNGVTLFAPVDGTTAWLIDMQGRSVHHWETRHRPATYGELLPNGNLLYACRLEDGPLANLEGAGGKLLELDWNGRTVWQYEDPYLHGAFNRLRTGATLVIRWIKVPEAVAARVKGGHHGPKKDGIMWGDAFQEITPDGKVSWEWIAHEHLKPDQDKICPLCPCSEWTHANGCIELPDGNILVSFMKTNTIAIIDKRNGDIKWRWGPGILGHQHSPSVLDNGNILVFDNGYHPNGPMAYSRVLEISPYNNNIVWSYEGGEGTPQLFFSSTMSSCQRLPNGNTLICEGETGRLFEVSPRGELIWEYVTILPLSEQSSINSGPLMVYSAYRYGMDYSGLKRPIAIPEEWQSAPGTTRKEAELSDAEKKKEAIRSRLNALGY